MFRKKGITVTMMVVTVVVLIILATTITISISSSTNYAKLSMFATEIQYVQDVVDEARAKESALEFTTDDTRTIVTTEMDSETLEQFSGETITNDSLTLQILNLGELKIASTQYGKFADENDVYAVSGTTGRVYYVKGITVSGKTYYTLTEDMVDRFGLQSSNNSLSSVVFIPSIKGYTKNAIRTTVKLPESFTVTEIVTDKPNVTVSGEAAEEIDGHQMKVYQVNLTDELDNYEITVEYNDGAENKTVKYKVNGFDIQVPQIKDVENSELIYDVDVTGKTRAYATNITVTDDYGKIKSVKYEEGIVTNEMSKEYFATSGKIVRKKRIPLVEDVTTYTIYAEDYAGNYTTKQFNVPENILAALVTTGNDATVSGIHSAVLKRSSGLNLVDYKIYGNTQSNLFDGNYKNGYIAGGGVDTGIIKAFSDTLNTNNLIVMPCEPNTEYIVEKSVAGERFVIGFTDEYPTSEAIVSPYKADYTANSITLTSSATSQYLVAWVYNHTVDTNPLPEVTVRKTTPTVEKPVQIISLGDSSKNLVDPDISKYYKLTNNTSYFGKDLDKNKRYTLSMRLKEEKTIPPNTSFGFIYKNNDHNTTAFWLIVNGAVNANYNLVVTSTSETPTYDAFGFGCYPNNKQTLKSIFDAFDIQLEEGEVATEYRPYRYIDVISESKNLFNSTRFKSYINTLDPSGIIEGENGYYAVRPTTYIAQNSKYMQGEFKSKTQYTLSVDWYSPGYLASEGSTQHIRFYYTDGTYTSLACSSTTAQHSVFTSYKYKTVDYIKVLWNYGHATYMKNIQLEEGAVATTYKNYQQPITTTIDFSKSKNILPYPYPQTTKTENGITFTDNGDGSIKVNGTATANANFQLINATNEITLEDGVTYFMSGCPTGGGASVYKMYIDKFLNGVYEGVINDYGSGATIIGESGYTYRVNIIINTGETVNNLVFKPMIVKGNSGGKYLSQLSPRDSLGKFGDASDYIDYENSRIVRNVGKYVLTGTEDWKQSGVSSAFYLDVYALPNVKYVASSVFASMMSTHYSKITSYNSIATTDDAMYINQDSLGFKDTTYANISEWEAFLAAQYVAGTPVTVYYNLQNPEYEYINLPAIPTVQGTTILQITDGILGPSKIIAVYKK